MLTKTSMWWMKKKKVFKVYGSLNESILCKETLETGNMKLIITIWYANDEDDVVAYAIIEAFNGNKYEWDCLPDFDSFTWVAVSELCQ